jgi:hypothetical protein
MHKPFSLPRFIKAKQKTGIHMSYRIPAVYVPPLNLSIFSKTDNSTVHKHTLVVSQHKRKLNPPGPIEKVNFEEKYSPSTHQLPKILNASKKAVKYQPNIKIVQNALRIQA